APFPPSRLARPERERLVRARRSLRRIGAAGGRPSGIRHTPPAASTRDHARSPLRSL
ncbi:MAG: hypothetical protein AVDCRST_MAG49-473, partial [uncultured Thermomicrobiales bacterium]